MKTYDEIEEFIDYTKKEEWKSYITNSVVPLLRITWVIKEYFEELKREFDNLPLSEVEEENRPLLLGGIRPSSDEIYSRNSLAKFYRKFFGLKLKDLQSWILQQQHGETLTEITVEVAETEFIKLVREILNLLDYALQYQTLVTDLKEPQVDYKELKKNPEKVKELIKDFYQALLNITLNHNYGTFFLCSINQLSYRTMKIAYPRIDQALEFLQNEFGLIELNWNNPINPETQTFKDYTIYCFPEYNPKKQGKSFGGAIVKLNELLWSKFSYFSEIKEMLGMLFGEIPNLKEEFRERVKSQLPEKYHSSIYFKGITASENASRIEESGKTLMEMLDENMPWLFTNLIKIDCVYDNGFSFTSFG